MGAGLLPRAASAAARRSRCWSSTASSRPTLYGMLMNLSCWPFPLGIVVPGPRGRRWPTSPARRCWRTCTASSSTRCSPRPAAGTPAARSPPRIAIVVLGPAILTTLRRAARRAVVIDPAERASSRMTRGSGRPRASASPRPSRLDVVTHSVPVGRRRRPCAAGRSRPRRSAVGLPTPSAVVPGPATAAAAQARPSTGARRRTPGPRGRRRRSPDDLRVDEAARPRRRRPRPGPAVVAALLDQVELVPGVVAELRGPQPALVVQRQALHVAVAQRPDRRRRVGVAGRGLAVGGDPQDLAAQGVRVLGQVGVAGLAGGDVEHPVGPEGEPAAVVDAAVRDAVEDRPRPGRAAAVELGPRRSGCPRRR